MEGKQVQVQGSEGLVTCTLLGETQIGGSTYLVIDPGIGSYARGIFSRYLLVAPHLVLLDIPNKVEIVDE